MINPVLLLIRVVGLVLVVMAGASVVRNVTDALTLAVGGHTWNVMDRVHQGPSKVGTLPHVWTFGARRD